MGMYTQFYFRCRLLEDTPGEVLDMLEYMTGPNADVTPPPVEIDHPLFTTSRWASVLYDGDLDRVARRVAAGEVSGFKNYDNEIGEFVDWISPYVDARDGEVIGVSIYEAHPWPVFYTKHGASSDSALVAVFEPEFGDLG